MTLNEKATQTIARRQHIAKLGQESRKLIAELEEDAVSDLRLVDTRAAQVHIIKLLFIRVTGEQLEV